MNRHRKSEVDIFQRGHSEIFMATEITALFILNPFRDWNLKFPETVKF